MLPFAVHDAVRLVEMEARSALPNAPVRFDRPEEERAPRFAAPRRWLSLSLRRFADAIEPTPACTPARLARR
jgi:hypothetical protein